MLKVLKIRKIRRKTKMSKENCEREARQKIAASIGALPEEIYFTSGRADGHRKVLKAVIRASKKARPPCDHYDDGRSRSVR